MNKADCKSITYHPQKSTIFFFNLLLLDVDECSKNVHSCDVNALLANFASLKTCLTEGT